MSPAVFLCCLLLGAQPASAQIGVVGSPVVERWLRDAGVESRPLSGRELTAADLEGLALVIVPAASVQRREAAETLAAYAGRGGRLLGIYWGTIRQELGPDDPLAPLAPVFGVQPLGWRGSDRPRLHFTDPDPGWLPYGGREVTLGRPLGVIVQPRPGAQVLARWGDAADAPPAATLNAGHLFLSTHLLFTGNQDRPEARDLLLWGLQRLWPEVGRPALARERVRAAAVIVGQAEQVARERPALQPVAAAARRDLTAAREAQRVANWAAALTGADRARAAAQRVLDSR